MSSVSGVSQMFGIVRAELFRAINGFGERMYALALQASKLWRTHPNRPPPPVSGDWLRTLSSRGLKRCWRRIPQTASRSAHATGHKHR